MSNEADTSITSADTTPDWLADDDEGTSATQDTPAEPASEASTAEDQPEPAADKPSRPRDVTGRFSRSTSVTPQHPLGSQRTTPTASATSDAEGTAPVEPQPPAPFQFKADGRDYSIPGLQVPPEHEETLRQLLAEGMHHRTTWQAERAAFQTQVQQREHELATKQASVDALSAQLVQAFQDPDKLAEMYANWTQQGPIFLERARQAALQTELDAYRQREAQSFEQVAAQAKEEHLWGAIERTAGEKFPGAFDEASMATVYGELAPLGLIQIADKDYPEYGYQKGDILLDEAGLYGHLARYAEGRQQAKATQELAATKVAKVVANNAAVVNGGRKAPPVVAGRTSGQAPRGAPKIKSAKDWRGWVDSDDDE